MQSQKCADSSVETAFPPVWFQLVLVHLVVSESREWGLSQWCDAAASGETEMREPETRERRAARFDDIL